MKIINNDVKEGLKKINNQSIHCVVTSPPYWGLRDYGVAGQIGQEPTPDAYVQTMVEVFREVRRVLHDSGTVWLNLGDTYSGSGRGPSDSLTRDAACLNNRTEVDGLKPKDLCLIPWRLAIALQADGWWVRSVICWAKKSCMPESVTDRPTNSWEPIFLLAKSSRYYYDAEAVRENVGDFQTRKGSVKLGGTKGDNDDRNGREMFASDITTNGRNQRNVWHLGPEPYAEAHFATFPSEIPRRAILAGTSARGCCPKCRAPWVRKVDRVVKSTDYKRRKDAAVDVPGSPMYRAGSHNSGLAQNADTETRTVGWEPGCECNIANTIPCTVLDPFLGSGTTLLVARELHREGIGIEINPLYCEMAWKRLQKIPVRLDVFQEKKRI